MQKDCHYYGTFLMACLAGFKKEDAEVIAWAAETVDELNFVKLRELRAKKYRIPFFVTVESTRESIDDVFNLMSIPDCRTMLRGIWVPFHFLPGNFPGALENGEEPWEYRGGAQLSYATQSADMRGDGMTIENVGPFDNFSVTVPYAGSTGPEDMKLLCRTSTATVRRIIENARTQYAKYYQTDRIRALCAVGICMHVLADTWSHQGFAGTPSQWVNDCRVLDHNTQLLYIDGWTNGIEGWGNYEQYAVAASTKVRWNVNNPVYNGHGRAGTMPDIPGITWSISHQYGLTETCENLSRFSSGMLQMHDAMKYIRDSAGYLSDAASITNPEKVIDNAAGGDPGFTFRTWEQLKASSSEVLVQNSANPPQEVLLRWFLSVLNGVLLANRAKDPAERIPRWQRFLQLCSLPLDEYAFDKYDIVSFVKMARIHRAVVFRFLEDNTTIHINLDTVDQLVEKETIDPDYPFLYYPAGFDASKFDDPADFAEINNVCVPDWDEILGDQNESAEPEPEPAPAPSAEDAFPTSDRNTRQNTSSKWSRIFGTLTEYVLKVGSAATPQDFYREYTGKEYAAEKVAQYLEYSGMESDMRDALFLLADALM